MTYQHTVIGRPPALDDSPQATRPAAPATAEILEEMDKLLDEGDGLIERLGARLRPVVRDDDSSDVPGADVMPGGMSDLGRRLFTMRTHLAEQYATMQELLYRVDL